MTEADREAEQQAERLQALLQRLESGEAPLVVRGAHGSDPAAAEASELAVLALALGRVLPVGAPPAFKARLQADIQARLAAPPAPRGRSATARWVPRFAAAGLALALVLGSAVAGSADSLPGQVLYPVKRAVEDTRLALASDAGARARLRLEMAGNRASELRRLADSGAPIAADWIDGLMRAQEAAELEVGAGGDPELRVSLADTWASTRDALAVAAARVDARHRQPVLETVAAFAARGATATPAVRSTARPARQRHEPPATAAPLGDEGGTAVSDPPAVLVPAATSGPVSEATAMPPAATEPVEGAPRRDPPTAEPVQPTATSAPPEQPVPTDTPQPTLDRGAQREATVGAPSPTPTPRVRRGWPGGQPSPEPPAPTEDRA